MTLEDAYLEHILLHLRTGDEDDRPLRTYVDSWYAHRVGSGLMEKKIQRPQWMNRGDLEKRPELSRHCHALSIEAEQKIQAREVSDLAKDHAVPMSQLITEMKSRIWSDREQLRSFLLQRYRVAIVTQAEHARLSQGDRARKKAGSELPTTNPFARYDCPDWGISYRLIEPI